VRKKGREEEKKEERKRKRTHGPSRSGLAPLEQTESKGKRGGKKGGEVNRGDPILTVAPLCNDFRFRRRGRKRGKGGRKGEGGKEGSVVRGPGRDSVSSFSITFSKEGRERKKKKKGGGEEKERR